MSATTSHKCLLATAISAALSLMSAAPVAAQAPAAAPAESRAPEAGNTKEQDKKTEPTELETVVVVGSKLLAETFVSQKRESMRVVDSIGETETGLLPAQNAAELVSMLPGVLTFSDRTGEDNLTTTEGRFASVRGIRPDLNITTMDGLNLGIPNQGGRSNFLDWFPVTLAKRVEVIKTLTPEDDAHSIGGQINIVTRSGFDYADRPLLSFNGSLGTDELDRGLRDQRQPFDTSFVYARPLSPEWAIAVTANFNRRDVFLPSRENVGRVAFNDEGNRVTFFPGFNNFIGGTPGNGIAVPLTNRQYANAAQTDRSGFAGRLDYRPDSDASAWITWAYSRLDQVVEQSYSDVRQPFLCFPPGCTDRALSQRGNAGRVLVRFDDAAFSESAISENLSQLKTLQGGFERYLGTAGLLEFRSSWSQAKQEQTDYFSFYGQNARDIEIDYDLSDWRAPQFSVADPTVFDAATYNLRRIDHLELDLGERVWDNSLKYGFNAGADDRGFGFKVGARYKRTDRDYREFFDRATPLDATRFVLSDILSTRDPYGFGIPGASGGTPPLLGNVGARNAQLLPLFGDPTQFRVDAVSGLSNNYGIVETTLAGFFQAQHRGDNTQLIAGMRRERTEVDATGFRSSNDGPFEPVRATSTQSVWLPSLLFNWDISDEFKLRFGYSRSLGRPPYDALAPKGELLTTDPQAGTASLVRSNPGLRPRRSDNIDLAAEWYFDEGRSLLSAGFFHKRIKDEIFLSTEILPLEFDGVTYATTVSQPRNAESATLNGLELSFVKSLNFLPAPFDNLGIQANATLIDGDFSLQRPRLDGNGTQTPGFLPGQPERIYNVSLYYSDAKLDVNLGFNRTEPFVVGFFPTAPQNDIYHLGRNLLSAKVGYTWNEHVRAFAEGNNLLSKDLVEVSGPPEVQSLRRVYAAGRTFNVGLIYTW
jgi:TonB-dependent receptor